MIGSRLILHGLAIAAFALGMVWVIATGSNRSAVGYYLGLGGGLLLASAFVSTLAYLVIRLVTGFGPQTWRQLGLEALALGAGLLAGFLWLGLHIA